MKRSRKLPVAYLSYDDLRRVADDGLGKRREAAAGRLIVAPDASPT